MTVDEILKRIRTLESGGNYTVVNGNPNSSAAGAYQFVGGTWRGLTRRYGIGTQYHSANVAPPHIQDQVARRYVEQILAANGGNVEAVPATWYVGRYDPNNLDYIPAPHAGNTMSVRGYIDKWFGTASRTGANAASAPSPSDPSAARPGAAPVNLPPGFGVITSRGKRYAVYGIRWGEGAPQIAFELVGNEVIPEGTWNFTYDLDDNTVVYGGSAAVLEGMDQTKSFSDQVWEMIDSFFGPAHPAREALRSGDADSLLKVFLEYSARPDMSEAELQRKIDNSDWSQRHNEQQKAWNSANPADRERMMTETAAQISTMWFDIVGERRGTDDPLIRYFAGQIASGKMTMRYFQVNHLEAGAAANPESPYSRDTRSEEEQQRQRGIDLENMGLEVTGLAERWGIQMADDDLKKWASDIVTNRASNEDLVTHLRTQASILYPWKDPEMETLTASTPWTSTFERVMEKKGGLFNPKIQAALTQGQPVFEFEKELKKSDEWLNTTKNARDSISEIASSFGRIMGFQ